MINIQVGEYVRTKNGSIFKIIGGNADDYLIDVEYYDLQKIEDDIYNDLMWLNYNDNGNFIRRIVKQHSFNLIDLIEAGDYVNGHKVYDIEKAQNIVTKKDCIAVNKSNIGSIILYEKSIKTIVTKERFKQIEYEVKTDE